MVQSAKVRLGLDAGFDRRLARDDAVSRSELNIAGAAVFLVKLGERAEIGLWTALFVLWTAALAIALILVAWLTGEPPRWRSEK